MYIIICKLAILNSQKIFLVDQYIKKFNNFRNAIIYYLKEIHGIRDETFKYKKINDLFNIE